jgi:hypothetical protein
VEKLRLRVGLIHSLSDSAIKDRESRTRSRL